ncbi:MAG: bifunctional oligoribonuclease/PAP phosphatase NrnA [Gemmatimonadota bacterium]|nr:bifunctional oligoribonuclease/PAP phosphatase NrnA [Gemmatimonadota bacterium]
MTVSPMSPARAEALEAIRRRLHDASSVVLTTHVNPDGDGIGSMVALASRLLRHGAAATIVTPSRPPASLRFLLSDIPALVEEDPAAADPLNGADTIAILDTAEPKRLGGLPEHAERMGGVLIDHHPPVGSPLVRPEIRDPSACATGELVYDLLSLDDEGLTRTEAEAIYAAISTDTGSFRFSNTSPRAHAIASVLLETGVDTGALYRELYGVYSRGRLALMRLALEGLEVDPRAPIAWIALDRRALSRTGARSEDMEGLVEFPRRLAGMEVGLLFRGLARNRTKVSLRSNGEVDVSGVAQLLGGGGHAKASGVLVELDPDEAVRVVLDALRPLVEAAVASEKDR